MPANQELRLIEKRRRNVGWYIAYQRGPTSRARHTSSGRPPRKSGKITIDAKGSDDISGGLLKSIYDQAGWPWPPL